MAGVGTGRLRGMEDHAGARRRRLRGLRRRTGGPRPVHHRSLTGWSARARGEGPFVPAPAAFWVAVAGGPKGGGRSGRRSRVDTHVPIDAQKRRVLGRRHPLCAGSPPSAGNLPGGAAKGEQPCRATRLSCMISSPSGHAGGRRGLGHITRDCRRMPPGGETGWSSHMAPKAQKRANNHVRESGAQSKGSSFPIVGVGASAGGLVAFTELLTHLPLDTGMGFVLVQHLDPEHESALTQLLARATKMPVREITNNQRVEANCVYVIPPNTNLGIARGVLKLQPRPETRTLRRRVSRAARRQGELRGAEDGAARFDAAAARSDQPGEEGKQSGAQGKRADRTEWQGPDGESGSHSAEEFAGALLFGRV